MGKPKTGWRMWPPVVILRYWLFQGMLYMNWIERLHRLSLELSFAGMVYVGISLAGGIKGQLAISLLCAHTANLILNGHLFALFKHDLYWFGFYKQPSSFLAYVECIQRRLAKHPVGLTRAEIYGSLTLGRFSATSDLDIRLMAQPEVWNGLRVAHMAFLERLRALFAGFPLDIYVFRTEAELRRKIDLMKEKAIVLFSKEPSDTVANIAELAANFNDAKSAHMNSTYAVYDQIN